MPKLQKTSLQSRPVIGVPSRSLVTCFLFLVLTSDMVVAHIWVVFHTSPSQQNSDWLTINTSTGAQLQQEKQLLDQYDYHLPLLQYGTRCYFNIQSTADMSQLNLLHGTNN